MLPRPARDCRPLLAGPDDLTVVFAPIVDLTSAAVAGYAASARFPGTAPPEAWFLAAAEAGLAAPLQALALDRALAALPDLPPGAFLQVDVDAGLLDSPPVVAALAAPATLRRVVVRLAASADTDLARLRAQTAELRGRGARIAAADAGSGWSGLQQLAQLRPQLVCLDPALVRGAEPSALALAELVGTFARRIDAWLLAGGVETAAELAALVRLGVPLASGWLLGRPTSGFAPLPREVVDLVRGQAARARLGEGVAGLLRPVRQRPAGDDAAAPAPYVLVDDTGTATGLVLPDPRTGRPYTAPVSLCVPRTADVPDTLRRALDRAPAQRFDPVLCTTRTGEVLGLLRVDDLASAAVATA